MSEIVRPKPGFKCGPRGLLILTKPDFFFFKKEFSFPYQKSLFLSHICYGETGALAGPALGAPQAVILLENLIAAGVKECLVYGWAGAIREEVPLGRVFWIETALSLEGTSRFYGEDALYKPVLSPVLEKIIQDIQRASVVSVDALYRETTEFCQAYGPKVMLVDMEVSALYAVASFRRVKILALVGVSDRIYPRQEKISPQGMKDLRPRLLQIFGEFLGHF